MYKAKILIDCDGVLSDFTGTIHAFVKERYGRVTSDDDITQWDCCAALGLTPEQTAEVDEHLSSQDTCSNMASLASYEAVSQLRNVGTLVCVTSPYKSEYWETERARWLLHTYAFAPDEIVFSHAKHEHAGDYLIDDKTSTLIAWQKAHPDGVAILFERPWNCNDAWDGARVTSWNELVERVTSSARVYEDLLEMEDAS